MALTIVVEAELFAGVWTAITGDTLGESGLTIDWGMDGGRPDDNCARPGTLAFTLNNAATIGGALVGRYSPGHANALVGWDLNTALRVTLSDGVTSRVMGPYRVVSIVPEPNLYGGKGVAVLATDWLEDAAQAVVVSQGDYNVAPGTLIAHLLDGMSTAPASTSLDTGATVFNYPLSDASGRRDRVLAAFKSTAQSDGGHLYLTSAGVLTYRAAATRAADTTPDYTFSNGMHGLVAGRSREALVNSLRLTVHPPTVSDAVVVLASLASPLLVAAGATLSVVMDYRDPDTGEPCGVLYVPRTPEPDTDWLANAREDGTGTDLGSNFVVEHDAYTAANVTVTVNNLGAVDGYLTLLQVRGQSVVDRDPVTVQAVNSASVAAYGERTLDVDLPYQHDPNVAQALADYWAALHSDAAMRADSLALTELGDMLLVSGAEHLTDGGLENWASATDLSSWTEYTAGTSTVNREGAAQRTGSYAARMDIAADNSQAYILQAVTLVASRPYRISFWYKTTAGKPAALLLRNTGTNVYLQSDGTWTSTAGVVALPAAADWTQVVIGFSAHASYTAYQVFLGAGVNFSTSPSSSAYFDDVSLVSTTPLALGVDVGSRLAITESMTGLVSASYWVQGVTLSVEPGPVCTLDLRLAPAMDTLYWLLGTAGRSELDSTTVLGYL